MKIYFRHNEFRNGQDTIINDITSALSNNKNIVIHAPTGTGKSDASLSAAITYALENDLKVLFLTPKISQHKIAIDVVKGINDKYDLHLQAIDFVGKRNMCSDPVICDTGANFYEICRKSVKKKQCPFYENIRPSDKTKKEILKMQLEKKLKDKEVIDHQEIKKFAVDFCDISKKPQPLCAYELAKIKAKNCNIIIADYYHVFSPNVSNAVLGELGIDLKDCVVIVDEAHNLEERLLKLASKTLSTFIIHKAIKEARNLKNTKVRNIIQQLLEKVESINDSKLKLSKEQFIKKEDLFTIDLKEENFFDVIDEIEECGLKHIEVTQEHSSALITIALFLEQWIQDKKTHIRFIKKEKNTISVKFNALDVSDITKNIFNKVKSTILMSATLTPLDMYCDILGIDKKNSITKEYDSPFDKNKKLNLLINDVSTKFTNRSKEEYKKIGNHINNVINTIPGNSIVFFPSFQILNEVLEFVNSGKPKLIQEENQSSYDFENMINEFKNHARKFGATLFAVMGGKASEGIDLPGSYLVGAVVVGIPLARMELETKAKIDYYQRKFNNGWLYSYIQPAIQKVIQSAGRVIRTNSDKGVIVYMDQRYMWENYRKCIPHDVNFKLTLNPNNDITEFFDKN